MPRPLSLKKRSPGEVVETETPIFNQNSLQKIDSSPSPEKPQFLTAETPTLKMKKLTDQFRAALVLHQDKQDYDQEASLKFKSLMCELIANKHKKIIENPQMEKKDGVQEFLDQKKKLGSSVFRSTKNINQTVLTDGQNGLKRRFTLNKSNSGEKLDEMRKSSKKNLTSMLKQDANANLSMSKEKGEANDDIADFESSKFMSSEPETSSYDLSRGNVKIGISQLSP